MSNKREPTLVQMSREGVNMADVRKALGVKSLSWERTGHVMRIDGGRLVKAVVLGWGEQLERWQRVLGGRRKTVLYSYTGSVS